MEARARRNARVPVTGDRLPAIPDLVGCESSTLVIKRSEPAASGPPAGTVSYAGRWVSGGYVGDAEILVLPMWSWGAEVHLALSPPTGLGRVAWSAGRLDRLAERLTAAVVEAMTETPSAPRRFERTASEVGRGWMMRPASGGSPSR